MFFQVALLAGYLYAHCLRRFFGPRLAWQVHLGMLVASAGVVAFVQAHPPEFLKPTGGENLTLAIVRVLAITVGLPFVVLSSTGPLVQAWHSLSHGGKTYRLYALSNLGSMLALFSYPFLFERWLAVNDQAVLWSVSFFAFAVLCGLGGLQTVGHSNWISVAAKGNESPAPVARTRILVWLLLAMTPSIMLMATTNLMSQEVASIPFLWVLPLTLYLLSLIICFDRPALYRRVVFTPCLLVSTILAILVLHISNQASLLPQVLSLALVCFSVAMSCHGELERLKPDASQLTLFYLVISVGGALGGIFVAAIAPRIFSDYCEFHTGLLLALVLVVGVKVFEALESPKGRLLGTYGSVIGALVALGCVVSSLIYFLDFGAVPGLLTFQRNEYGLVSIREAGGYRVMVNGRTEHGGQWLDAKREFEPSGYYIEGSGPSVAIRSLREAYSESGDENSMQLKVGVIGLGTGSLVSWSKPGDEFWFYEINPLSETLARKYFTYLDDRQKTKVVLGDGRVQLENQLREEGSLELDILFLDAFSSDSIPAHLLTQESFELYWKHLKPNGVLVAISTQSKRIRAGEFE